MAIQAGQEGRAVCLQLFTLVSDGDLLLVADGRSDRAPYRGSAPSGGRHSARLRKSGAFRKCTRI